MYKLLATLVVVSTAWASSQYLTSDRGTFEPTPDANAKQTQAPAAGSVALLDLALGVLPHAPPDAEIAPADEVSVPVAAMEVASYAPAQGPTVDEPISPQAEAELARRIQTELRRVGCLKSSADGVWGPASKRAMQRFAGRIDAELPTDRPDHVLLMLVERFDDRACGKACAPGTAPNHAGRCLPRTEVVVASTTPTIAEVVAEDHADSGLSQPEAPEAAAVKAAPVRTEIRRARVKQTIRASGSRTIWSPPTYSLGMVQVRPAAKVKRSGRRLGASAAYRRWMKRSGVAMR